MILLNSGRFGSKQVNFLLLMYLKRLENILKETSITIEIAFHFVSFQNGDYHAIPT